MLKRPFIRGMILLVSAIAAFAVPTPARAIDSFDIPAPTPKPVLKPPTFSLSDARAYGESTTQIAIVTDPRYQLQTSGSVGPHGDFATPFTIAAYIFAGKKATYAATTSEELSVMQNFNCLVVHARDFSELLHANDDMVAVIKQNGKVVLSRTQDDAKADVVDDPRVGYRTTRSFYFSLDSFHLDQPFTIVIANAVTDGLITKGERSWDVDTSAIR